MEITNRTGIEKTVLNGSQFLIYRPSSILSYRVTLYPFPTFCAQHDVSFELPGGNGRDSGIAGWENMGMGFKFQMGMGMKSLKWEGIGTKNLFPHTSISRTAGHRSSTCGKRTIAYAVRTYVYVSRTILCSATYVRRQRGTARCFSDESISHTQGRN